MRTVALVGGDGAGKTSVAKGLEKRLPFPVKYLYMGPSILSSDVALPSSRLARSIKLRLLRKAARKSDPASGGTVSSHDFHYVHARRSPVWLTARLLNRLAEASYRHGLSLVYRWQGQTVVYDRHFLFDALPDKGRSQDRTEALFDRLEFFLMNAFFPKPGLVIFLDASPEVLYGRKNEADIDYLARRRAVVLEQGRKMDNFVRVDAARPLEQVLAEVTDLMTRSRGRVRRRSA